MNLCGLYSLQSELDEKIRITHNLNGKNLIGKKILSLQVEIGELANETRCFKYWSTKPPAPKNVILEEYVDCLHFILSLGLDYKFTDLEIKMVSRKVKLTEQFINLFIDVTDCLVCSSRDHYTTLFEDFLILGYNLGFTEEVITEAYYNKNQINHTRQNEGY
jgi:dimeric dUTPase (all-alpha-NTP-PPase superfamily)